MVAIGTWQPTLLASSTPSFDVSLNRARRRFLTGGAWLDIVDGWVDGADALFDEVLSSAPWGNHDRVMYDRIVAEPRLSTRGWQTPPPLLTEMGEVLSARYGLDLSSISANLYRDGDDSVAWHGDRIGRRRANTVVAILTLGSSRKFLMRPTGGGTSVPLRPGGGDLLVMGGTCQRTWEHSVPKCSNAGPRISVMWREAA